MQMSFKILMYVGSIFLVSRELRMAFISTESKALSFNIDSSAFVFLLELF